MCVVGVVSKVVPVVVIVVFPCYCCFFYVVDVVIIVGVVLCLGTCDLLLLLFLLLCLQVGIWFNKQEGGNYLFNQGGGGTWNNFKSKSKGGKYLSSCETYGVLLLVGVLLHQDYRTRGFNQFLDVLLADGYTCVCAKTMELGVSANSGIL